MLEVNEYLKVRACVDARNAHIGINFLPREWAGPMVILLSRYALVWATITGPITCTRVFQPNSPDSFLAFSALLQFEFVCFNSSMYRENQLEMFLAWIRTVENSWRMIAFVVSNPVPLTMYCFLTPPRNSTNPTKIQMWLFVLCDGLWYIMIYETLDWRVLLRR